MLIDASVFGTLKWVGLIVAVVLSVMFRVLPEGQPRKFWGLLAGIALALGLGFGVKQLGDEAVVVKRPKDGPADKRRVIVFGSPSYAFQDGTTAKLVPTEGTLVVNDGFNSIEIRSVAYGSALIGGRSESIAPMSTFDAKYGVDYVGPDDKPPEEVQSKIGIAMKYWLTW